MLTSIATYSGLSPRCRTKPATVSGPAIFFNYTNKDLANVAVRQAMAYAVKRDENGTVSLTRAQLSMLLEGIDWRRVERTAVPQMAS